MATLVITQRVEFLSKPLYKPNMLIGAWCFGVLFAFSPPGGGIAGFGRFGGGALGAAALMGGGVGSGGIVGGGQPAPGGMTVPVGQLTPPSLPALPPAPTGGPSQPTDLTTVDPYLAKRRTANHPCPVCGKHYVNEGSLRKHLACHPETSQLSSSLRMWPCSVCQAVFTHESGK